MRCFDKMSKDPSGRAQKKWKKGSSGQERWIVMRRAAEHPPIGGGAGEGVPGDNRVPLYHRLHDKLRDDIESGVLRPGDRIATEAELSTHFGVSRTTVKQAIQRLVNEGLVYRVRGKGTFVSQPRIPRL
ncbi:GntR family transcriptional regulator [Carboxydichorda subterranea]|uniref:GntR family transcriptional regulator n=1 Tax=Carboxydichorda subterranea TaxID=3109565 RepID=UPI003857A171